MTVTVHHGDSREVLKGLADASVDSVCCDPPYALAFMGQAWDTGETAFDPAFWREVLRVLKPGGHVVAFGAGRGVHRLASAIEAAGFEIRDRIVEVIATDAHVAAFLNSLDDEQQKAFLRCIEDSRFGGELAWIFGSGFPKSHDVSKAIDKILGATGEFVATAAPVKRMIPGADQHKGGWEKTNGREYTPGRTEAAKAWHGWGTALKPALEPIVLARKPLQGTVAANILEHGTGALNIDGCRIDCPGGITSGGGKGGSQPMHMDRAAGVSRVEARVEPHPLGRWPANVVHDGSDEVDEAFPAEAGAFAAVRGTEPSSQHHGDTGSAARFFYSAKADAEDRLGSKHPTVKPVDLMAWLCRLVTPPGGTVLDPFAGSGTTGLAAMNEGFGCILIEREAKYIADIERRLAWARGEGRTTALEMARLDDPKVAAKAEGADLPLFSPRELP